MLLFKDESTVTIYTTASHLKSVTLNCLLARETSGCSAHSV